MTASATSQKKQWGTKPLRELVDDRGITYGIVQPGQPQYSGTPILRVNNFTSEGLDLDDVMMVDPIIAEKYRRSTLQGREVLITLVGSVGLVSVVPPQVIGWNVARAVGVAPIRPEYDPRWIAWCLQTPESQRYIEERLNTTVQKTFNLKDLAEIPIPLPPQAELKAITGLLGALDETIDLNRKMSETLLALMSAVWKQAQRRSGSTEIPVSELAEYVNGGAFTKGADGTGRPILRIRELNGGVTSATPRSSILVSSDQVADNGDLLFSWSGSLDVYRWFGPESLINQHIFKVLPKRDIPQWLVHLALIESMPFFQGIARDKATTMGHIQRRHLSEARIACPTPNDLADVRSQIVSMYELAGVCRQEQLALLATRSLLIPALINGKMYIDLADGKIMAAA